MSQIICGDALQLLPTFKDKEFDYFLTSPPFKEEEFGNEEYWNNLDFIITELKRITSKGGFLFQSSQKMKEMLRRYPEIVRVLIWGKSPSLSAFRYEPILVWQLDSHFKINKYIWKDLWVEKAICGNGGHRGGGSYENPVRLYKQLLQMLPRGKVIDPFLGTGTTIKACRLIGHSCVGIEINPKAECFVPTLQMEAFG